MKHVYSGNGCLVAHFNIDGTLAPSCIKCKNCGGWIRPENMQDECPGNVTKEKESN